MGSNCQPAVPFVNWLCLLLGGGWVVRPFGWLPQTHIFGNSFQTLAVACH